MHYSIAEQYKNYLREGGIYGVSQFIVRSNNQRFKLTPHQYVLRLTKKTIIFALTGNLPTIPTNKFWLKNYNSLQSLGGTNTELPDVIGKIRIIQGINLRQPNSKTIVWVGLEITRNTIIKVLIWDEQAAYFRQALCIKDLKHSTMLITSINPKIYKGPLK
ncbi:hypothetical protein EUTSA_v10002217mg [Eutrema salsugineum]|uniref:DUF223 domain-containing protein n=1 Tax=Eutrema salsugineum TaxID=72664 RepID=V4NU62_EUTSA|nr:hypothetical protein EUTSA_v10002217mg [Eutrema salsugineum]